MITLHVVDVVSGQVVGVVSNATGEIVVEGRGQFIVDRTVFGLTPEDGDKFLSSQGGWTNGYVALVEV